MGTGFSLGLLRKSGRISDGWVCDGRTGDGEAAEGGQAAVPRLFYAFMEAPEEVLSAAERLVRPGDRDGLFAADDVVAAGRDRHTLMKNPKLPAREVAEQRGVHRATLHRALGFP